MMRHVTGFGLVALVLLATSASPQSNPRGAYYRNAKHEFELWIPAGFTEKKAAGKKIAEFHGGGGGSHVFSFEVCGADSIQHFVRLTAARAPNDFPGVEVKIHRFYEGPGLPAAVFLMTKLDANAAFRGFDLVEAGALLGDGKLLRILLYAAKGKGGPAVEEARRMLATVRRSGERGLDAFLGPRRLHLKTGVSYRPPLDLEEKELDAGSDRIFEAASAKARHRFALEQTRHPDLQAALAAAVGSDGPILEPWDFPGAGPVRLRGGVYGKGTDQRRVVVAAHRAGAPVVLLTCQGRPAAEDALIRQAELIGMSLDIVDIAAAREQVAAAATGLRKALKKDDDTELRAHVKTLGRYAYLPEARAALAGNLNRLGDSEAIVSAVRSLGATHDSSVLSALLKAATYTRNQGLFDPLVAILETLGQVRGPPAIPVLVKQAQRDKTVVRAAAVRALGFYEEHRKRVMKELIRLMKREEASSRKTSPVAKERWEGLEPAFKEAMKRLTGQSFGRARDAQEWLRRDGSGS